MQKNPLRVFDDITQAIGMTPMIKIDRFMAKHGIKCQVYVKYEPMNPGQSVKDRIGLSMIELAEKSGKLKPGDTIVECTSGNTGLGLAMVAAIKGYKLIITIPDKMSLEKINTLKAFGAEVIVCKTELASCDPRSYKGMAKEFGSRPGHFWVNQYENEGNPLAHYNTTGVEICEQMENNLDICFIGAGTGGTISGTAKRIKETIPNCKIVGIDPVGSILAQPESMNTVNKIYKAEGLGQGCVPGIMRRDLVDAWVKADDPESFVLAREIIKTEGMMVGGSSGTILSGMIEYIKANNLQDNENLRFVVLLPDSAKNYMSKFMGDDWMIGNRYWGYESFIDEDNYFGMKTLTDYRKYKPVPYYDKRLTVGDCIDLFKKGFEVVPIRDNGKVIGIVDKKTFVNKVAKEGLDKTSSASNCIDKDFLMIDYSAPMCVVQKMLENRNCVLLAKDITETNVGEVFVMTHNDLIDLIEEDFKEYI